MTRSAITSSSPVLMPGSAAAATSRRTCATTSPASRISASCFGVLISIPDPRLSRIAQSLLCLQGIPARAEGRPRNRPRGGQLANEASQGQQCPIGHVVDRPGGIDPQQDALIRVVRDQRLGLLLVDLEAVPDRLLAIVIALEQLS